MMIAQAPFPSLDCGFLIDELNQNPPSQFQQQQISFYHHPIAATATTTAVMLPEPSVESVLKAFAEKQREDLDHFVQQQNNLLRANIQRQAKQHLGSMVRALESRAALIIRTKDDELAAARNKALQLEACVKRIEREKEGWEKLARESEALAVSFSNALEQLQSPCFSSTGGAEEEGDETTSPPSSSRPREFVVGRCRACGVRDSCVLLLPCRHVCCCELCDVALAGCPVCEAAKEASVQVFLA